MFIDKDEKGASPEKHTQLETRVLKPYFIYNQNGQNRYPIYMYDQNGCNTPVSGAAHTYIAHKREYPLPRVCLMYFNSIYYRLSRQLSNATVVFYVDFCSFWIKENIY